MLTDAQLEIKRMHEAYCRGTGFDLPLDAAREMQWYQVWHRGIRSADITDLIRLTKWKIANDQPARGLKFRSFVGNPDFLEEDVVEMRAKRRSAPARAAAATERAEVLAASGRPPVPAPPPARTAGELLPNPELNQDFEWLKQQLREGTL